MFHHITKSKWGVVIRRIPKPLEQSLDMGPIRHSVLLGIHNLYHWSHEDAVAADKILKGKSAYLNTPFFIIRQVVYFSIWGYVGHKLYKASIDLDKTGDWGITSLMRKVSAPAIPFGLALLLLLSTG